MLYTLRWGKDPIVVAKREEGSQGIKNKATRRTNQCPLKKRKSRQDAKDDKLIVNISMRKMILEVGYSKSMIYEILKIFRRITYFIPR